MTHQATRKFKVDWIMARVKAAMNQGKIVDEEKLVSEFCLYFGAGRRYALEYLKDLEITNRIKRIAGEIWTPEHYDAQEILHKVETKEETIKEASK